MKPAIVGLLLFCLLATTNNWALADTAPGRHSKPQKIVSLSLCIDQVLMLLVDKSRIAAVTHLAPDAAYSYHWRAAQTLPVHYGQAEDIVPLQPDLVIGVEYSDVFARQLMGRLGLTIKVLESPGNLTAAAAFIRAIGQQVGEPERAEQLIDSMHRDIAKAKTLVQNKPELLAISYGPNGYTAGTNTLKHEILTAAGYRNLASELGIEGYGNISLEQLIWSAPDIIILDQDNSDQHAQAQSFTNHPVLARSLSSKQIHYLPTSYWLCPGPSASKAILALAEQRR